MKIPQRTWDISKQYTPYMYGYARKYHDKMN